MRFISLDSNRTGFLVVELGQVIQYYKTPFHFVFIHTNEAKSTYATNLFRGNQNLNS